MSNANIVLATERLSLREARGEDASFFLALMNEPGWQRYIRRHEVTTIEAARSYVHDTIIRTYSDHGFGLWVVELTGAGTRAGLCGLVKRTASEPPDLGFAMLEKHQGRGYATEAARAAAGFAFDVLGLAELTAIAQADNARSIRVLERLGFRYGRDKTLDDGSTVRVYELQAQCA